MSRILALLSGKGGSGKTTLALSISSLLADCGIRVLLVDCDLSTNGATYFYEKYLSQDQSKKIDSIHDICSNRADYKSHELMIKKNLCFIPSILSISYNEDNMIYSYDYNQYIARYFNSKKENYDIILFDCQAGYTHILDSILRLTDINLVVMEADAISSASVRSLYLKISNIIDKKKVFQVFNKVTKEEDEIYSKISGGTFFTNIGTIVFDWKVRKSFAIATVPDMESTSSIYGAKVYELCKILFPEMKYQEYLNKFKDKMDFYKNLELSHELEQELINIRASRNKKVTRLISLSTAFLAATMLMALIILISYNKVISKNLNSDVIVTVMVGVITLLTSSLALWDITTTQRERRNKRDMLRKQLDEVTRNIDEINYRLNKNNLPKDSLY